MAKLVKKERMRALYEDIAALDSPEACERFFEDLCSPAELTAMEQRYAVAGLLLRSAVYTEILAKTSASTSTISRVSRVLSDGHGELAGAIRRRQAAGDEQAEGKANE